MKVHNLPEGQGITGSDFLIVDNGKETKRVGFEKTIEFFRGGVESFLQSYISNPNLLPNWYFADPANQRGLTEYVGENHIYEMYSFDQIQVYNGVSCELVSNGLKFSFPGYADAGDYIFGCPVEYVASLRGKIVTMSILVPDLSLEINNNIYLYCKFHLDYRDTVERLSITTPGLHTTTFKIPEDAEMVCIGCGASMRQPVDLTIMAAKLEEGNWQTLAHQDADGGWVLNDPPPNKTLELLKCQRYFLRLPGEPSAYTLIGHGKATSNSQLDLQIPIPAAMRGRPSVRMTGEWVAVGAGMCEAFTAENMTVALSSIGTAEVCIIISGFTGLIPNHVYTIQRNNDGTGNIELSSEM